MDQVSGQPSPTPAGEMPTTLDYSNLPSEWRLGRKKEGDVLMFIDQPTGRLGREKLGIIGILIAMGVITAMGAVGLVKDHPDRGPIILTLGILTWIGLFAVVRDRIGKGRLPIEL